MGDDRCWEAKGDSYLIGERGGSEVTQRQLELPVAALEVDLEGDLSIRRDGV